VGCHFYRAESRGKSWDPEGNHIEHVRSKYQVLSRPIEEPGCLPIDKVWLGISIISERIT
jgi:hypothetical protein